MFLTIYKTEQPPASLQSEATALAGIISSAAFSPSCQFFFHYEVTRMFPTGTIFRFEHKSVRRRGRHTPPLKWLPTFRSKPHPQVGTAVHVFGGRSVRHYIPPDHRQRPSRTVWDRTDVDLFASTSWRWPFQPTGASTLQPWSSLHLLNRQRDNLQEPTTGCLRRTCAFAHRSTCCGPHSAAAGRCSTSVAHWCKQQCLAPTNPVNLALLSSELSLHPSQTFTVSAPVTPCTCLYQLPGQLPWHPCAQAALGSRPSTRCGCHPG